MEPRSKPPGLTPPGVEFLWWRECPSWERALGILREEMAAAGLDPAAVEVIEIRDEDDATAFAFPGSPTIRVNGTDIAGGTNASIGLTCRVYRRPDGRISPLPDPIDIRTALSRAERSRQ